MHLVFKAWILSSDAAIRVRGPCFTAVEEDGSDKRLVGLELAFKADGVAPPDPVQSGNWYRC